MGDSTERGGGVDEPVEMPMFLDEVEDDEAFLDLWLSLMGSHLNAEQGTFDAAQAEEAAEQFANAPVEAYQWRDVGAEMTMLHWAAWKAPTEEILRQVAARVVAASPVGTKIFSVVDNAGQSPLHLAAQNAALSPNALSWVMAQADTVTLADKHGNLPLHAMLVANKAVTQQKVDVLLHKCDTMDCLSIQNAAAQLPLHRAAVNAAAGVPPEVFSSLMERCPDALGVRDAHGQTVLHILATRMLCGSRVHHATLVAIVRGVVELKLDTLSALQTDIRAKVQAMID